MDSRDSSAHAKEPLTMILAMNKLKETEERIYQAKHRLDWINNRHSRVEHKKMWESHMSSFKEDIRKFADS